jgi:DNA-binding response OmpR family regulator
MTQPRRILVVEDEPVINGAVSDRLTAEGYDVAQAYDGPGAVRAFAEREPDLVVLDVMLPGFDGHEVCRRIQAVRPVPVLMLTARDDETDILVGLGVGADDYVTKPFRMRELVARVAALLRRVDRAAALGAAGPSATELGDLRFDAGARRVWAAGDEVHLTPTEFDLLVCLASEPGTVLTRERLLADVWGWPGASGTRTVDSHVKALRAKIGADRVRTVHGVGYALEAGPVAGRGDGRSDGP